MGSALGKPSHSGQNVAALGFFLALNSVGFPKNPSDFFGIFIAYSYFGYGIPRFALNTL